MSKLVTQTQTQTINNIMTTIGRLIIITHT